MNVGRVNTETQMDDLTNALRHSTLDAMDDEEQMLTVRLRIQRKFAVLEQQNLYGAASAAAWGGGGFYLQ